MPHLINSLTPGRCGWDFKSIIFTLIIQNNSLDTCCEIALRGLPQSLTNEKSRLIQAPDSKPLLGQCWSRSMLLYGVTRPVTHWGRVTHVCISKLTIIVSDNGLSPGRRQAIIWTNAGMLLILPLGTHFSKILTKIHISSFSKMHFKMSSGKWQPFCLGLNVLNPDLPLN